MSFSGETKHRLIEILPGRRCCRLSLLYGMLEGGRGFSRREMSIQTEYPAIGALYTRLLDELLGVQTTCERGSFLIVTVPVSARETVLARFGHEPDELSVRLNRGNFRCDDCAAAYLRGLFLACGAISNPETDYHLEFNVPSLLLSRDIVSLWEELGYEAKSIRRKGDNVIYFKDSETIEECLTLMGAGESALALMQVKMLKDIRNRTNRAANCDLANISKMAAAAEDQLRAIQIIEQNGGLSSLPDSLQEVARLRRENPLISLRELGEMLEPPLTRSGVNHRLQRIGEIAAEIEREQAAKSDGE